MICGARSDRWTDVSLRDKRAIVRLRVAPSELPLADERYAAMQCIVLP